MIRKELWRFLIAEFAIRIPTVKGGFGMAFLSRTTLLRFVGLAGIAVLILGAMPFSAQESGAPSKEELAAITARGRKLAEYEAAAAGGTNAMLKGKGAKGSVTRYIAQKTDRGWVVDFGSLNDGRDAFLVAYEATEARNTRGFKVQTFDPARADTGFDLVGALAMETCLGDLGEAGISYQVAVLPAESGQLYVYVLPAQTDPNTYVYGADVRYLVSADGTKIVEKHGMHKALIDTSAVKLPSGAKLEAGTHGHILSDRPEDSDVLLVLARKPAMPEYVGTKNHRYLIHTDGSISELK